MSSAEGKGGSRRLSVCPAGGALMLVAKLIMVFLISFGPLATIADLNLQGALSGTRAPDEGETSCCVREVPPAVHVPSRRDVRTVTAFCQGPYATAEAR
jgi:hypothetical protein